MRARLGQKGDVVGEKIDAVNRSIGERECERGAGEER
jgi:hypothetical protein